MMKKIIQMTGVLSIAWLILSTLFACAQLESNPDIGDEPNRLGDSTFLVGVGMTNVTPPVDTVVWDSLYAKTVVFDNGNERVAFVVVDNQGLPTWLCDDAKAEIYMESGIPASNIMISATHTHAVQWSGDPIRPTSKNAFQQLLIERITGSVRQAVDNLQPARIGWGSFSAPEYIFNRRWFMDTEVYNPFGILESVRTNPAKRDPALIEPAGPTDPEVSVIAVKSLLDEPIAIFANYSLHFVGTPRSGGYSADYYGHFAKKVREHLGVAHNDLFLGIMSNGTSGDVNNEDATGPNETDGTYPYQRSPRVADDLAIKTADLYNSMDFHDWIPLKVKNSQLTLQIRQPSQEILDNVVLIKAYPSTGEEDFLFHKDEQTYVTRLENYMRAFPSTISIPLQAFSFGDLAIGAIPFEVFAETGLQLKDEIPFDDSFIIGLANGHWGYLPTPAQHLNGGYESWITANRVEENSSELIVDEMLNLFDSLQD